MNDIPEPFSQWLHVENRTEYVVLMVTNQLSTKPDFPVTVVYKDKDGNLWSRPLTRWLQRYVLIRTPC